MEGKKEVRKQERKEKEKKGRLREKEIMETRKEELILWKILFIVKF